MVCKRISFTDFRNIEKAEIEFCDGVNILYGNNAVGKTNALEGIYLFANGKSFRTSNDRDLINFSKDLSFVKMQFEDSVRKHDMEMKLIRGSRKLCYRNGVNIKKLSDFVGYFRAVLFCPEHLSVIKDGPSERRSFLDAAICQIKPIYLSSLQKYNNILNQRNILLKNYEENKQDFDRTIELWSAYLAREASLIARERYEYVKILNLHVKDFFNDMTSGKEDTFLEYNKAMTEDEYYEKLTHNLEKEIQAGSTLYGIHKDDIDIYLNGREARSFCSQGQQRCLALAMKLGEGEISRQVTGEYPVLLFDDIFSELDSKRKEYVTNGIKKCQVIITSCEKDGIQNVAGNVIHVDKGNYTRI
ncbi:MAG: DNA replication/repair protein RecF [Ruminococcaceae bacterium]|nr:DNA replication/repair protein RecF [Oscillospiraceae bacterium]